MTLQEIITKLEKSPSYITHKSNAYLAKMWGVSESLVQCAKDYCKTPSEEEFMDFNSAAQVSKNAKFHPSSIQVKSAWQNAKGEMQYSYKVDTKSNIQTAILESISGIVPAPYKPKKYKQNINGSTLEISLADLHLGKTNPIEKSQQVLDMIQETIWKAKSLYSIDHIVVVNLGDLFNTDGNTNATTKGTKQNDVTNYKTNYQCAIDLLVSTINLCLEEAPVSFVNIQGNHDWNTSYYFGQTMRAYYRLNEDVTCYVDNGRHALNFGNVSIMYDHGEIKSNYALLFATEFPKEWSMAKYREIHVGHFHSEMTKDQKGCVVRHLVSPANHNDEWHYKEGWINNKVGLQSFIYTDKLEAILYS